MKKIHIQGLEIESKKHKLIKPYVLSFGTISELESIVVKVKLSNGSFTTGEAVPLKGYSEETGGSIKEYLGRIKNTLIGKEINEAREFVEKDISKNPFACSPILTAIDLLHYEFDTCDLEKINFVIPTSSSDLEDLQKIIGQIKHKTGTIKIKLSGKISEDIKCIDYLESQESVGWNVSFDANKAFTFKDAEVFYQRLSGSSILSKVHYVEQPLTENAWTEHEMMVNRYPLVKTMLDESIVTIDDLNKAISINIPFVKFKLFKQGGIKELVKLIEAAYTCKVKVVIGNGVATSISNSIENTIYNHFNKMIYGASEANGFLKIIN